MFKTLRNIIRTGNATVAYPDAPLERPEYARGKPEHSLETCIACAACANACPPNAIQMVNDEEAGTITWSINYGRCVFCGRCEEVCPTRAIQLSKEFELAVFDKADLQQTATYPLARCTKCDTYFISEKELAYDELILRQNVGDQDAEEAVKKLGLCPDCKRALDAERAAAAIQKGGDPTPAPTSAEMDESRGRAAERKREEAAALAAPYVAAPLNVQEANR